MVDGDIVWSNWFGQNNTYLSTRARVDPTTVDAEVVTNYSCRRQRQIGVHCSCEARVDGPAMGRQCVVILADRKCSDDHRER